MTVSVNLLMQSAKIKITEMSKEGLCVIAVVTMKPQTESDIPEKITDCSLTLLGLIGLADPPRESVKNNIVVCNKAGIRVVMITGYVFKFGVITNGLGIVRHISFYNNDFLKEHPDIVVEKKSDSPDEDKSLVDSKALIPVLKDFFKMHPLINPKTFLGDSAFDTIPI